MMIPLLDAYRIKIERELQKSIEQMGEPSRLRDACSFALLNGGKRLRPILVLLVAEALPKKRDVMSAALCVEYFHTASLIADDLPCMDNDDVRRNKPALHKEFEESVAILASYTLIAAGYGGIYETSRALKERQPDEKMQIDTAAGICLETVTRCAGLRGATFGQYLDLFPPDLQFETLYSIIQRKTGTLFEISFVLGWLFGGGTLDRLEEVKRCANHFGAAFQLADDLDDFQQDKDQASRMNVARAIGIEPARKLMLDECGAFIRSLESLGLVNEAFRQIGRKLTGPGVAEPVFEKH